MNDPIGNRTQKFDGGTGGLDYHDENFPGGDKDMGLGKKRRRMATPLGMME